jgi:hypothetical protein
MPTFLGCGCDGTFSFEGLMMLEDQAPNRAPPPPQEEGGAHLQSALSAMAEVAADEANLLPPPSTGFQAGTFQPTSLAGKAILFYG